MTTRHDFSLTFIKGFEARRINGYIAIRPSSPIATFDQNCLRAFTNTIVHLRLNRPSRTKPSPACKCLIVHCSVSDLLFRFTHVTTILTITKDPNARLETGSADLGNNASIRRTQPGKLFQRFKHAKVSPT